MPERDLELLIKAAETAGQIALKYWQSDHKSWDKGNDEGPATEADLEVDAYLKDTLLDARPDHGWLSEETSDTPDRLSRNRVFVIDPIDGTRNFAAGKATWAHSLAIVEDGQPTAAVVYLPAREKLYTATAGGAFLNGTPISPAIREDLSGADVLAPRNVTNEDNWRAGAPELARHFRPSLAYRMALVAEGRFDAMITLRDAWEWDIAAGALIGGAAGAMVSDRQGKPLCFNSQSRKLNGVLIANPALHRDIDKRLK